MSDVSSVSASALSSVYHRRPRALEQQMFQKIDANGDDSISQAELESAVTGAGGTTQGADTLFAQLDPNNTGSVSNSQFVSGFQALSFSAVNGQQLIDAQAQASGGAAPQDPFSQMTTSLFGKLDADGDGTLTQSELEKAVTAAGGSTASADALYAQLDPNNTGSVSQAQFAANFPKPGAPSASTTSANSASGDNAQAALGALFQSMNPLTQVAQDLFSQLDANGDGTLTKSELEQAVTAKGGTAAQADALYAKLDPNNTGAVTEQQFTQYATANTHAHHMHHGHGGGKADDLLAAVDGSTTDTGDGATAASDSGNTAQDAASALLKAIQQAEQQTAGGGGQSSSGSTSQVAGVTSTTTADASGGIALASSGAGATSVVDALEAAIQQLLSGTSTPGASTLASFDPSLYQSMFGANFSSSSMSALLDAQSTYPLAG